MKWLTTVVIGLLFATSLDAVAETARFVPPGEEIAYMDEVMNTHGRVFSSQHNTAMAIQFGAPYKPGEVLFYMRYGDLVVWGREIWVAGDDETFTMSFWRFYFREDGTIFTSSFGQVLVRGRGGQDIVPARSVDLTADNEDARQLLSISEEAWQKVFEAGLETAGYPPP